MPAKVQGNIALNDFNRGPVSGNVFGDNVGCLRHIKNISALPIPGYVTGKMYCAQYSSRLECPVLRYDSITSFVCGHKAVVVSCIGR